VDPRRYVYESLGQLSGAVTATAVVAPDLPAAAGNEPGLARLWAELLGLDAAQIQPGDNFFDLGGSSLLAMRAVSEGESRLGLKVEPRRYVFESLRQLTVAQASQATTAKAATVKEAPAKSRLFGLFGRGKP
jgi:acyl carrier protein